MKLAGCEYNLEHKALEIYLSGCKGPHCPGCHNQPLWDFNFGHEFDYYQLSQRCDDPMIEQVWILGGEPQDQDLKELNHLLSIICKDVVLFTRYTEIKEGLDRRNIDYVKYGPYDFMSEGYIEPVLGLFLASRNQWVEKIAR